MAAIQEFIDSLPDRVEGIKSILITDRDGVVVLRGRPGEMVDSDCQGEQILTTIFSMTTDQCGKLGTMGVTDKVTLMHDDCVVVQANHGSLVITTKASEDSDVDQLHRLIEELKKVLDPVKDVIDGEMEEQMA